MESELHPPSRREQAKHLQILWITESLASRVFRAGPRDCKAKRHPQNEAANSMEEESIDNFKDAREDLPKELPIDLLELNLLKANPPRTDWILDSRASKHVTSKKKELLNFSNIATSKVFKTVGGQSLPVIGKDLVNFGIDVIKDSVFYLPGCHKNLLSVKKLADKGLCYLFTKEQVFVLNTKKKIACRSSRNKTLLPTSHY